MFFISIPQVPDHVFKPTFEIRIRGEKRDNRDFRTSADDLKRDWVSRIRAGIAWTHGKEWSGELQYQYGDDRKMLPTTESTDKSTDLSMAYVRRKAAGSELTVGRQKFAVGSERLVGPLEWTFASRSFDGVRYKTKDFDAFAVKIGVAFPPAKDLRFAGVLFPTKDGAAQLFFKHDKKAGFDDLDLFNLGYYGKAKFHGFDVDYEANFQAGKTFGKDHEAWAAHLAATKAIPSTKTKFWIEGNAASGGGDATKTKTFDNLLPTNHKFYGSMDLQGWRNMTETSLGIEQPLTKKFSAKLHWHRFWLFDAKDAWYGASGGANSGPGGTYVDPTGASGKDVGRELDLEFLYNWDSKTVFAAGAAAFTPGRFVQLENGGTANRQTWIYFWIQRKL